MTHPLNTRWHVERTTLFHVAIKTDDGRTVLECAAPGPAKNARGRAIAQHVVDLHNATIDQPRKPAA